MKDNGVGQAGPVPEYTISQLALALDVTQRAIRFYEEEGLLAPRRLGNIRIYSHRDRARLQLILRGKRLGFSLADIKEWLALYDVGDGQLRQTQLLLARTRRRIAELERQRDDLATTLAELREVECRALAHLREHGLGETTPAPMPLGCSQERPHARDDQAGGLRRASED